MGNEIRRWASAGWGHPALRTVFKWGCRAASTLAAVAVCGGGKCAGGMNPSPTDDSKRDMEVGCGPGMPGPYRTEMGKWGYKKGLRR